MFSEEKKFLNGINVVTTLGSAWQAAVFFDHTMF